MTLSIAVLLGNAADGDEHAWRHLVTQYDALLRSVAYSFRLSPEHAADAAQTTWLRLIQNVDKVREPEKLGGWLACTMRRECIRALRHQQREQPTDDVPGEHTGEGVEAGLLLAERDALLWSAVDRLPARQRALLIALSATPTPSYKEVGRRLGMAVGSIGPTRGKALRRLRELLVETGGAEHPVPVLHAGDAVPC
ncbi:MAG: rpoE [Mycobacterium sp.]|jgi:RNA polymerase sigma factor (sigma-70 family)|nr:rpoE [Mycobacterium sp.]